jgi:riboflavin kinase
MEQFTERLGYEPFPGTLNVELDEGSVEARARMDALDPVRIDGWEDDERTYGPAFCWPATVVSHGDTERTSGSDSDTRAVERAEDGTAYEPAHVIAPERTHHGADQLEVIAPEKLRETLSLDDGTEVTVRVTEQ